MFALYSSKTLLITFCLLLVCDQVEESVDFATEMEFQDELMKTAEQVVQSNTTESTEFTLHLKPSEAEDTANEPEDDYVEQSTGSS